jgi:zinc transport system substrate-binding protein
MVRRGLWVLVGLTLILALGLVPACTGKKGRAPGPVRAVVTIAPLAGLVKPLLPPSAEIKILMAPGRSEHGEEFTADDLANLAKADLVVLVGMSLEPKVEAFLKEHPDANRQVVNFAEAVGVTAEHDHAHDHDHDHGHEHCDHSGGDPHLWLDPVLVAQVVPSISKAAAAAVQLAGPTSSTDGKVDTAASQTWTKVQLPAAESELLAQVLKIDDEYREALKPHAGKGIVTHHAAWGRLAERYGLKVAEVLRPVESVEPDAAHTATVIEAVKASGTGVIFIEPAYDRRSADRIAQASGARLVTIDPLGTGDWTGMMRANLAGFLDAFGGASAASPTPASAATPAPAPVGGN